MNTAGNSSASYQYGFTLLELLVVLLILGSLTALIPPLFSGAVPGAKLKGAALDLAATLHYARNQAITRNSVTEVILNTESPQYSVGSEKTQSIPAGIRLNLIHTTHSSGPEPEVDPAHRVVKFFPDGSASGTRITVEGDKRGYQLNVDWLTGKVVITGMEDNAL